MIVVAILIDFVLDPLLALGFLGIIADIIAVPLFYIWLGHYGVSLYGGSYTLGSLGTTIAEAIPIIDDAPWWTIRIASIVVREWRS